MKREITLRINDRDETLVVEDADTLLEVLRDRLKLWSVRESCGVGACGSCTVLLDGRPVSACFLLAVRSTGREIITLEGLGDGQSLHPIQEAFVNERALQCAYCTPDLSSRSKRCWTKNQTLPTMRSANIFPAIYAAARVTPISSAPCIWCGRSNLARRVSAIDRGGCRTRFVSFINISS